MSDVKDELKNVLETKKRFTEVNVERVFQKIDEKQLEKKVYWKPLFAGFTILAALLALFVLLPKQQETTVQSENMLTQMEEKLMKHFEEYTNNRGDEIVYSEIGFEGEENLALIISLPGNGLTDTATATATATLHEYKNNEWRVIWKQPLLGNQLYISDTPRIIYAGGLVGDNIKSVHIGEKEVKPIKVEGFKSVFVTIHNVKTDSVIYHYTYPRFERLFTKNEDVFIGNLNLVNREGDEFFYEVKEEAMNPYGIKNIEVVVDPSFDVINRYDMVLVDDGINSPYLSRVVALPNDRFKVEKGTIILNDEPQHTPHGSAKVGFEYVYEAYVENHSLTQKEAEAVREIFTMNVPETEIQQNEFMLVSDDWLRGEIAIVKKEHIKGVVKGDSIQQLANEWTTEEKLLYQQMKTSKNKELLKNVEPLTIARLYSYARFLADVEMEYYFHTTRPGYVQSTYEEYLIYKGVTNDENMRLNASRAKDYFPKITSFVQELEIGYFVYEYSGEEIMDFRLILNENGYWEVDFW